MEIIRPCRLQLLLEGWFGIRMGSGCGDIQSLGRCSVLEAELWQILDGLDLLWKHGYRNIVVESNNAAAVKLLMNEGNARQSIAVARRIRSILDRQ
ncbi:hypothetical protein Gogos_014166 [Gossypium gossypioides]|uniref:RNase H type-1 domain-containing protein n=1 Tax=Gossypium gossypioides TaxID=34282 RepID=A0A7J9BXR3_GOSGO|nr:hypothetical protein [Gossypium gossypioides]